MLQTGLTVDLTQVYRIRKSQQDAIEAIHAGNIKPGDVVVIRYEGYAVFTALVISVQPVP